jgi:flagellar motility protein MotE (MotC chaperone)
MARMSAPRLLPLTILAMSGLLAAKSATLVRAAVGGSDASGPVGTAAASMPRAQAAAPTPAPPAPDSRATVLPPGTPQPPAPSPTLAVTDGERTVLLELRQRRQELDAREATVVEREATLAAAELRLNARVTELEAMQHKLEALEQAREAREDTSWQGLVKLYESMRPRDAATIFNDLDMKVLLGVVDRMKDAKAAPVLAAMQPDKAREVTSKLAALRTKRASVAQSN